MNKYPIQQLLRPPVELASATAYGMAAGITLLSPSLLTGAVSTPVLTYGLAAALTGRGVLRARDGLKLVKYQYRLHVLPLYRIRSTEIPISKDKLFLGLGFEWRERHTQRRTDIDRLEFDYHKDREEGGAYKLARLVESALKRSKFLSFAAHITSWRHWLNPVAPIDYVEGLSCLHAVGLWEGDRNITTAQSERVAHTIVYGTTRVGKTRLCEVLVTQDIHNNDIVIVFDPKGDPDLLKRMWVEAKRAGRLDQFYCFHLGHPEISARYNPVGSFGRITEPASRISSQLPGSGNSAAFREFTWRYVNIISKALTSLGIKISYESLLEYGSDIDPLLLKYINYVVSLPEHEKALNLAGIVNWDKALQNYVDSESKPDRTQASRDRKTWAAVQLFKKSAIHEPVAQALIKTFEYEKSFYDRLVASLFPLLEKLTSGPAAELLSPDYDNLDDPRPIFDWDLIIRTGGIVYVGLDALADAEVSQAVGNSMFSDLTGRAAEIYKHGVSHGLPQELIEQAKKRKICLHADELAELVGKEFIPMANKAGGAGFQITAYTQTLSDIISRFETEAKAGQVVGNLGNIIMLRVKEERTAKLLTDMLPDVEVNQLTLVTGVNDDSNPESSVDFTSSTQQRITSQRVPMINAGDITRLPKGQAYAFLGGRLYKIRLPRFKDDEEGIPKNLNFLYSHMKENYSSKNYSEDWAKLPEITFNG